MFQIKYGIVSEVKAGYVRVKFEEDDNIVSDWLPIVVPHTKSHKISWPLEINEHVVCFMDKHCEEGVCVGAIPNEEDTPDPGEAEGKFRIKFSDDTLIEYDSNEHKLTVDVKGKAEVTTTDDCKVTSGGKLEASSVGDTKVDAGANLNATAVIKATVVAPNIEITGIVKITGATTIVGALTVGGLSVVPTSGGPGNMDITGDINITGQVEVSGDVVAAGKSLSTHVHAGVQTGGGVSGPPQ